MLLGFGPVLRYELITTARRGRYYLARVVYGLILLFLLWGRFQTWELTHPGGGTIEQVRRFAGWAFIQFAGAQGLMLLCLVPALVAGVIADEHQRKTLHYLLASRLSSSEIVLGKLGARLVHVGTFVALGLPVVCLLALYGGLNPENVFYVYLGTLTTVLFIAGFSILISILARRPREAILAVYGLEAIWLLVPPAIAPLSQYLDGSLRWVGPVNDALMLTNPVVVWSQLTNLADPYGPGWAFPFWVSSFETMFWWMVGIQGVVGLMFLVMAIVGLRPLCGNAWPGVRPRTGWWTRLSAGARTISRTQAAASLARIELLAAWSRRPRCGDDPMLWKERYITMGGGLRWLGSRAVVLFFSVLLGCYLLDVANPVLRDMMDGRFSMARMIMNASLRESSTVLAILGILAVAAAAAVSLTGEREQDTWVSLAATLLTPGEIIRAKQFGAVWGARWFGLALLLLWTVGTLLGAIHPLGLLGAAWVVLNGAWFVAAVGVFVSGRARNSTRALVATSIALVLALGYWPWMLWGSLVSHREAAVWLNRGPSAARPLAVPLGELGAVAAVPAVYAAYAGLLTFWSIRTLRSRWGQP
jgi:ABC-type transport system involved in multi-copper enzyme maturation permease subunit